MFESILSSLTPISLVFELLALALSFYLKDSRIFFIALALLCLRGVYAYASLLQAHLFVSLFAPFVFVLFVVMKKTALVFERKNLSKLAVLGFVGILALILSKSTNFNAAMSESLFELPFEPVSELSLVFFAAECVFLVLWGIFKAEMHFTAAFALLFVQFFSQNLLSYSFFEFASLFFVIYLIYHSYKSLYFDTFTKLPNQKALKRRLLGLDDFYLGGLRMSGFEGLNLKDEHVLLKKIGKILRKQKSQIFRVDGDFIFIFEGLDENAASAFLQGIKQGLENTNLSLKDKTIKLKISSTLMKNKPKFEENLMTLKEDLAPVKRD